MSRLQDAMSAVRANPNSSNVWSDLGDLLMTQGQVNKAIESYQRALQLDHQNPAAQQGLANSLAAAQLDAFPEEEIQPAESPPPITRLQDEDPPVPVVRMTPVSSPQEVVFAASADMMPDIDDDLETSKTITFADNLPEGPGLGKVSPVFRDPEPLPEKPSRGRVWVGVGILGMIPLFCLCSLLIFVAYLSPF